MGRKLIGDKKLTNAEKQKRCRQKQNEECRKEKDRIRKVISRENLKKDSVMYKDYLKKQAANRKILRSKTKNVDAGPVIVKMSFPAFSRSLNKVKKSLPREPLQKRVIAKALFEDSIQATPRKIKLLSAWSNIHQKTRKLKGRPAILTEDIKEKIDAFLCRNDISFTLPGRNNQVYIGKNEQGESLFKPKKYLLWTFNELYGILNKEEDDNLSNLKFSTFYCYTRSQKEYIIQSRIPEVACLCPDCENVELMCEGIGKACDEIDLPSKCHDLINKIACDPITECCAEGNCEKCPELDLEPIKDCDTITFYVVQR